MPKKTRGPVFVRFIGPIVDTLKELGNSGTAAEVADRVLERCRVSAAEQEETTTNGQSRVRNQIGWAKFYLAKAKLVDASQRGVWALTDAGRKTTLAGDDAYALFKRIHQGFAPKEEGGADAIEEEDEESEAPPETKSQDYRAELLAVLRGLPSSGFERVCQRLLRESGFQQVVVTGRSRDGGIDGHGVLELNPLVTFRVLFQCKRYRDGGSVTPSQVRDFRGAMLGRADKGLILTTGTFTLEARKEATRDGAPPIELVDGEKLVTMFELAEIGLTPKKAYDVDLGFFEEFRK